MESHHASQSGIEPERREGEKREEPAVTVHHTSQGRQVFTESDNSDGWIATDLTVDLLR